MMAIITSNVYFTQNKVTEFMQNHKTLLTTLTDDTQELKLFNKSQNWLFGGKAITN